VISVQSLGSKAARAAGKKWRSSIKM
jgi:hypothetical protein